MGGDQLLAQVELFAGHRMLDGEVGIALALPPTGSRHLDLAPAAAVLAAKPGAKPTPQ